MIDNLSDRHLRPEQTESLDGSRPPEFWPELNREVERIEDPQTILFELFKRFADRAAIITSGQITGMTLVQMAWENQLPFRVCTIDTGRLFPQTYDFLELVEDHYGIQIERVSADPDAINRMVTQHGEYLFFDSQAKQEYCCKIRKVNPQERLLDTLDVWITGLRRDQSDFRQQVPKVQLIDHQQRTILKVSALADWSNQQVWDYIERNQVPVNPLLRSKPEAAYYESLGCVICTTPIRPGEPKRAGRWRWQHNEENEKECGLHFSI
jgi:phosphoadenylyl-sulfate reductase (thioredoxin)